MRKFIVLMILPFSAIAGGFEINTQGIKGLGMCGAFTAIASDASSVFYNPGAMSFCEKSSVTLGATISKSTTSFLSPFDGNIKTINEWQPRPHFYANYKINEKLAVGLGYNSIFSYATKWDDSWEGRYIVQEVNLKINFIEPAVSYMINEYVSVGAGYFYGFGSYELRKALPVEGSAGEGETNWKGEGKSSGYTVGILFKMNEELSAGLTFRSFQSFKIDDGSAEYTNIPSSTSELYPATATFNTEFSLPAAVSGAASYKFTSKLITTLQVDYNFWSGLDSVHYNFIPESLSQHSGPQLNNTIAVRAAAQYSFTEEFDLRGGVAYDQSPYSGEHVNPEFPDANKLSFSVGAGYKINENLSADATILMENYFERQAQDFEAKFHGSYKTVNYIFGLGINYNF